MNIYTQRQDDLPEYKPQDDAVGKEGLQERRQRHFAPDFQGVTHKAGETKLKSTALLKPHSKHTCPSPTKLALLIIHFTYRHS